MIAHDLARHAEVPARARQSPLTSTSEATAAPGGDFRIDDQTVVEHHVRRSERADFALALLDSVSGQTRPSRFPTLRIS